eukprot:TRINITY_DN62129_c0_g1_i1.p2 TRINITY_DN62129_c0_g1~~TRINITY_DN62129_c0_g1_i1.p2  ORF type:complete len:182 (-),score=77.98 TRINITY_DN62129_c0_g1_i1:591-1136(-)
MRRLLLALFAVLALLASQSAEHVHALDVSRKMVLTGFQLGQLQEQEQAAEAKTKANSPPLELNEHESGESGSAAVGAPAAGNDNNLPRFASAKKQEAKQEAAQEAAHSAMGKAPAWYHYMPPVWYNSKVKIPPPTWAKEQYYGVRHPAEGIVPHYDPWDTVYLETDSEEYETPQLVDHLRR